VLNLVLGRLYSKALILPGKLDERMRKIAAVVNGGLTGDNLAAGYAIPAAAFRERYSRVAISVHAPNLIGPGAATTRWALTPPLPVACHLESVRVRFWNGVPTALSLNRNFAAPVLLASLTPVRVSSYPGGPVAWLSYAIDYRPAAPHAIAAGEDVCLSWPFAVLAPQGDVTFTFRLPHEV
jgi:hypothetical protein